MEERGITRNQLAKRIDARFEVVNKWYQGELEKMDLDILARIAMHWTVQQRIYWNMCRLSQLSQNKKKPRGIPRGFPIYIKLDDRMFYLIS